MFDNRLNRFNIWRVSEGSMHSPIESVSGSKNVVVIDDDLGRSGSGSLRPGFERLLAALCEGIAGAVFCIVRAWRERTRLAYASGIMRLVNTLIIDEDGIYDVRQSNDRLVLGMKASCVSLSQS